MNGLKPIKIPSAKEKVAAELRKAILSRKMKEGESLSLESVAEQLNVSITPVLGITDTYIREHYELRAILESACAELASAETVDISGIKEIYEEAKISLEQGDYSNYASLNRAFHSEIWEAAGNHKMANMIGELWNGLSMGNMVTEQEYAKISIEEHGRIMQAIEARDGVLAREEMYRHIMRSRDDMLTYYQ